MNLSAMAVIVLPLLFVTDARGNESVSCGSANRGALAYGVRLPPAGVGFMRPEPWLSRGVDYGTAELVSLLQRAAAEVDREFPGSLLGIGDLSLPEGGASVGHKSHQSGRDADLIFYSLNAQDGSARMPDRHMGYYNWRGEAHYARHPEWQRDIPARLFDRARNWALVKALVSDPEVQVERIFVSNRIERWIIAEARERGADPELIMTARRVMRQPSRGENHNDHFHIRITCSPDDIAAGRCRDIPARRRRRGKWRSRVRCPYLQPPPVRASLEPVQPPLRAAGKLTPPWY